MTTIADSMAQILLDKKAVVLSPKEPFTWASGIISPIYCDNRQLLSYPKERQEVAKALAELIKTNYPDATVIAGTATAGIPHAAWVSDILGLPMIYVRGKAKDHGRKTQIEGVLKPEDKVVLIDDLISTGGSVLEAARVVAERANVVGVAAIFTYELEKSRKNFEEAGFPLHTLTSISHLVEVAKAQHSLDDEDLAVIANWRQTMEGR